MLAVWEQGVDKYCIAQNSGGKKTLANLAMQMSFANILPSQIPYSLKDLNVKHINSPTFSSPKL